MMYTGIEATLGLWGASYLARAQNFEPARFDRENAQTVTGFQMAVAYTSTTLPPPL